MTTTPHRNADFFVSRAGDDANAAQQIAQIIESAGKSVCVQDWDFQNSNFMDQMHRVLASGARVVVLLSPRYLASEHCTAEWEAVLARDPLNRQGRLIVLRVAPCEPNGLLAALAYLDLVPLLTNSETHPDLLRMVVLQAVDIIERKRMPPNALSLFRAAKPIHDEAVRATTDFTGRAAELVKVETALTDAAAATSAVLIHGLAGVGKSTLAREVAWRTRQAYAGVWWLNAARSQPNGAWEGIEQGLVDLFRTLYPGGAEPDDRSKAAHQTLEFLSVNGRPKPWLLVYDNVDSEQVFKVWPPRPGIIVLATSSLSRPPASVRGVELQPWPRADAVAYLLRQSTRADLDESDAMQIAQGLGDLPLALRHAAAYLREVTAATPESYLEALTEHMTEAPNSDECPRSVFATLRESVLRAETQAPGAKGILSLASFFATDDIPEELFAQAPSTYPPELSSIIEKCVSREKALGALDRLSLIDFAVSTRSFSVHRLVLAAARDELGDESAGWARAALAACKAASPGTAYEHWTAFGRLLPHIRALSVLDGQELGAPLAHLFGQAADYLLQRGAYEDSAELYSRALNIAAQSLEPDSVDTPGLMVGMAHARQSAGRFEETEPLLQRALRLYQNARVPPNDPRVIEAMSNLAAFYHATKQWGSAEQLYLGVAQFTKLAHGAEHPNTAVSLNNLASLFKDTGRPGAAERLYKEVIAIGHDAYGARHPRLATWYNNLAELYRLGKRYGEAEPYYRGAIEIGERTLGPEHPDLAIWLYNFALCCFEAGDDAVAEPRFRRAIELARKVGSAASLSGWVGLLSILCLRTDRPAEALALAREAVAIGEQALAPDSKELSLLRLGLEALIAKERASAESACS